MAEGQRKILVVGGISKNIPGWILKAFEVEHCEQQAHFKRIIAPKDKPDVVIMLKSWVSHKQGNDARAFAVENNIPFIVSDGGWSMAVQRAVESGLTWFAHDIDRTLSSLTEKDAEEADTVLERAWEGAYRREYERAKALERRLKKDRIKLEEALSKLESSEKREDAAARVITEVREAAKTKQLRYALIKRRQDEVLDIIQKLIDLREDLDFRPPVVEELAKLKDRVKASFSE